MSATLLVRCACGWQVESSSEDEVVAATQEHGRRLHNMLPTREQVLAMLVPAEGRKTLARPAPPAEPKGGRSVG
jgi:predicted small metal-binding protein